MDPFAALLVVTFAVITDWLEGNQENNCCVEGEMDADAST
jgi:hypothetical protein